MGTTSPKHNREVQHFVDELNPGTKGNRKSAHKQFPCGARSRVFGPFPLECVDADHAGSRVPLSVAWQLPRSLSLRDASPGSESSPPGRFSGRRPCSRSAIARWQEATNPQSSEGRSQRACHTEGAHPTASGRSSTVALFKQSYPALAVGKLSLWVASPGDMSELPFSDRSLGRRPSVTLF